MRAVLDHILRRFVVLGRLTVRWPNGEMTTYSGEPGPEALMELRDARTVRRITHNPSLAVGEAYMNGGLVPAECTIHHPVKVVMTHQESANASHSILEFRWAVD